MPIKAARSLAARATMSTAPQPSPASVRIELLAPNHYSEEFPLIRDFLAYKKCCFCIPASAGETEAGWAKKREKWPADKLLLSAVAIDESTDQVVGFVHCSGHGHPCDMHKPKEGEIYVDEICVDKAFRRRGIGTQLMNWVEGVARERGATTLSLLVLRGNPSFGLYERLGFVAKKQSWCKECLDCCCFSLFFGSKGYDMMYKQLAPPEESES